MADKMLKTLAEACDRTEQTCYHEFLLRYSATAKIVYGFVEGKTDPCFYRGFIESLLPSGWSAELWPAGNKDKVYAIHREMNWETYSPQRICFFVDRDLSEVLSDRLEAASNIYITDNYSIENDVVNKCTCHRVLTEVYELGLVKHDEMDVVCSLFETELEKFCKAMIPIMSWIVHWLRDNKYPNDLDNINIGKIFSFSDEGACMQKSFSNRTDLAQYLHVTCGVSYDEQTDIISIQKEIFATTRYRGLIRGKWLFWFLINFCNSVRRSSKLWAQSSSKLPKKQIHLSHKNAMKDVACRGRRPDSLSQFLNTTYCVYIGNLQSE